MFVPDKRINIIHFRGFILIDDCYNANPDSVKAVLEMTGKIDPYRRKIAILGDMLELGKNKIKLHRSLSSSVIKNGIDELYTIGSGMKTLVDALKDKKLILKHFRSRKSLSGFLRNLDLMNSIILVKGSRGMQMEEFSKIISGRMKN